MRHPVHDNDVVTEEGIKQIWVAAESLLFPRAPFHYVFCTEKQRTRTTVSEVLKAVAQTDMCGSIYEEPDFGFQYLADEVDADYPWYQTVEIVTARRAAGLFVSVQDIMEVIYPPARVIRHVLRATMKHYAMWLHQRTSCAQKRISVLVGNHASHVYATLTPRETDGYPPNCSVADYDWEVDDRGKAFLVSSKLLIP